MRPRHTPFILLLLSFVVLVFSGCEEEKGITYIAWSPDGSEVAFSFGRKIFLGKPFSGRALAAAQCILEDDLAEGRFIWSPYGDSIYFAGAIDAGVGIWKVNVHTGLKTRLSRGPAKAIFPVVDPYESYLIYLSYVSGSPDLYLHNLETDSVTRLTNDPDTELSPAISPTGKLLAYVRARSDQDRSICLREFPSGEVRILVQEAGRANLLKFSPDGCYIAYTSRGNIYFVPVAPKADLEPRLIGPGEAFDWSQDSKSLIIAAKGAVVQRSVKRPERAESILKETGSFGLPAIFPEGDFLALALGSGEGGSNKLRLLLVLGQEARFHRWLYPDDSFLANIYDWCVKRGWYEDALRALKKAKEEDAPVRLLRRGKPTSIDIERAKILLARRKPQKAAELLRACGIENLLLAKIYLIHLENFSRAKEILNRLAATGTEEAAMLGQIKNLGAASLKLYARALRASEEGYFGDAVRIRQGFVRRFPNTKAAEVFAYEIGEIYWRHLGEPNRAFESFGTAIKRYPRSPRRFEALKARHEIALSQADYLRAFAELKKAIRGAPDDDARLDVVADAIKICLEKLHDKSSALQFAEESVAYAPKGDPGEAVGRIVDIFDRAALYEEANSLLGKWIEAYDLSSSDIGGLLRCISDFGEETFVEVRLKRVPDWFEERIEILASAVKNPEEKTVASAAAVLLSQKTSEGLIRTWQGLRRSIEGSFEPHLYEFEEGVLYLIANMAQNEGNLERALDYYARLSKAARNDAYLQTIQQCQEIISAASEEEREQIESLIFEFLNIERMNRVEFWGDASRLFRPVVEPSGGPQRLSLPAENSASTFEDFYRRLLEEGPEPLKDNAAFRLLALSRDRHISLYTALKGSYPGVIDFPHFLECLRFCQDYPTSEFFDRAFKSMRKCCQETANNWLFREMAKEVLALLREASKTRSQVAEQVPKVLLALGEVNCETLSNPIEGENYFREIIQRFAESPECPDAQWRLSLSLSGREEYEEARQLLENLIKEAPASRQVSSGDALKALAQILEAQGNWSEAQKAYIGFIGDFGDHPEVKGGRLLERIYPRLSDEAKRLLFEKNPEALREILPRLSDFEREKLLRLIPELENREEPTAGTLE